MNPIEFLETYQQVRRQQKRFSEVGDRSLIGEVVELGKKLDEWAPVILDQLKQLK